MEVRRKMGRVGIVGIGQTQFRSKREDVNSVELVNEAVRAALADAQLTIKDIDAIIIGNMEHFESINYSEMWTIDGSGGYMKPVMKITTGGTTGSTIACAGFYQVSSGMFDRVLVIGWEHLSESDTTGAIASCSDPIWERSVMAGAVGPLAIVASEYMRIHGTTEEDAARVAVQAHKNALNNPYAHLHLDITVDDVLNSAMLSYPMKLLDMCPTSDGACAMVFAEDKSAREITDNVAWVKSVATRHDTAFFGDGGLKHGDKLRSLYLATEEAYTRAGIKNPFKELDVIEMYEPSSWSALTWVDSLHICEPGEAPKLFEEGVLSMKGELPLNPSGGVISTNPIGATGAVRVAEAALQIRGMADRRQVPDVELAMATGFGGSGWSDVMILER